LSRNLLVRELVHSDGSLGAARSAGTATFAENFVYPRQFLFVFLYGTVWTDAYAESTSNAEILIDV
jgi:hypothetical protein